MIIEIIICYADAPTRHKPLFPCALCYCLSSLRLFLSLCLTYFNQSILRSTLFQLLFISSFLLYFISYLFSLSTYAYTTHTHTHTPFIITGFRVFVVPEAATVLFLNGASPDDFSKAGCAFAFQQFVIKYVTAQYSIVLYCVK
jgi:hypothetical protein